MLNFFQSICCFSNREKPDKANRPIQKPAQTMSIQPVITENTQSQVLENDIIETDQYLQLDNQYYIEQLDFQSSSDIPSTQQPSDFMLQEEGINYQPMQEEVEQSAKKEQTATRKKRVLKLWDATEDAQLRVQYEKHNGKWNEIAKHMPGRNVSQCCQRWRRLQPVKIIKRKQWTQVEDEKILELVQQHGKNWKLIALHFPGILSKQIRERYINKIDPEINTGPWTEAEDATIIKLYQEYGGKWSLISSHLKGRPENMVKNRFYCYIRRVHLGVQNPYQIVYHENSDSEQENSNDEMEFE
ncbi:unnamed protein product (macronuclear) [Paramecium tetraurelia]|uniref:Myb-like DNA-binding domain containing protein n=1 Tax=Paramecium tetraurelia TaxID=5888 RepID=A0DS67_PARTE|nr:uncharacterized protein GSPATT00019588001 [Paramecium tetraurelia]CAK85884.1 unnamed protein product [Paramecium tetraurelia]|eukprot:XP_001453281.1 hypothetical protein (macronuclear) [Paramecium tetraurelia strain d4-2]